MAPHMRQPIMTRGGNELSRRIFWRLGRERKTSSSAFTRYLAEGQECLKYLEYGYRFNGEVQVRIHETINYDITKYSVFFDDVLIWS